MNPELSKLLNELAIAVVSLITTVLIPWAFSVARAYAKAKIERVQNAEIRDSLNDAMSRLDLTAETVVGELNQTLRDDVAKDGKLTKEAAKKLLTRAYNRTLERLPEDAKATLGKAFQDRLQRVIVGKIEKKVGEAKVCKTPTA